MSGQPGIDLTLATVEDVIAELERRGLAVAMVLAHASGGFYAPSPDAPPQDRERVVVSRLCGSHPANKAAFLCRGIQRCLSEAGESYTLESELDSLCTELSFRLGAIERDLQRFVPE
jgi:hypothetical protein